MKLKRINKIEYSPAENGWMITSGKNFKRFAGTEENAKKMADRIFGPGNWEKVGMFEQLRKVHE